MDYAYVYNENGTVKYNYQLLESFINNYLVPRFNQKTGADAQKAEFIVVSDVAINIDEFLLINA